MILVISVAVFANEPIEEPKWQEPINLSSLNSEEDDFAPVWNYFQKQLYFNSTIFGNSSFFTSKLFDSNKFSPPEFVKGELNKAHNHQSFITFLSEDLAYFSSYRLAVARSYINIFQSISKRKVWTSPFPVDSVLCDCFTAQPSISPDGSTLAFVSDRYNSDHNTDVWVFYRQEDGTWTAPVSIRSINSSGNEITPFLASNDTLYFSSDGHDGPGGYDLFYSVNNDGVWQRPQPLNELNTQFDESDFSIIPDGKAVFASNRPGGKGKLDLYLSERSSYKMKRPDDFELSVSAQVSYVKSNSELSFQNFALIPFIFNEPAFINKAISINKDFSILQLPANVDSVHLYTIPIIGKRLNENPLANLYINLYLSELELQNFKNSSLFGLTEKLKNYFVSVWEISPERITINHYSKEKAKSLLYSEKLLFELDSDNDEIFEPIQIGNSDVVLDPPALDVLVDARPRTNVKEWKGELYFNNLRANKAIDGEALPQQFMIDLKPYRYLIHEADSLVVNIISKDNLSQQTAQKLTLNITHTESLIKDIKKINSKSYELFFLTLHKKTMLNDKLLSSIANCNSIIINYFSDDSSNSALICQNLKSELIEKLTNKNIQIDIQKNDSAQFANSLSPYLVRILVEKEIVDN